MSADVILEIRKRILTSGSMSAERVEAMRELPLPLQLALVRRHYKITQSQLAAALGTTQGLYSRLENKNYKAELRHYQAVAKIMMMRVSFLLPKL